MEASYGPEVDTPVRRAPSTQSGRPSSLSWPRTLMTGWPAP